MFAMGSAFFGQAGSGVAPSKTVSLLHFEGANNSTTFTDEKGKIWTAQGAAKISTLSPLYGAGSLLLGGAGDCATTPDSADFQFGSGDFCIDVSVMFSALPVAGDSNTDNQAFALAAQWDQGVNQLRWLIYLNSDGTLHFAYSSNGTTVIDVSSSWSPVTGTRYDVRTNRNGNDLRLFVNGVQLGATKPITPGFSLNNIPVPLYVGARATTGTFRYFLKGKIDEVRITKGDSLEITTYTPALPWAS